MKYQGFLTRKYLTSRLMPIWAVVTVAGGVFVLMVTLAVMEGFKVEVREKVRGTLSHLRLESAYPFDLLEDPVLTDLLRAQPHVQAIAPYVETPSIFRTVFSMEFCQLIGIDPMAEAQVGKFASYVLRNEEIEKFVRDHDHILPEDRVPLTAEEATAVFSLEHRRKIARRMAEVYPERWHGLDALNPPQPILVGIQACLNWALVPGRVITVSSISGGDTGAARTQNFLIVGAYMSGTFDHDSRTFYAPLRSVQEYLDLYDEKAEEYRLSGFAIRLDDYAHALKVKKGLNDLLPELSGMRADVRTWEDGRQSILRAVDNEKNIMWAIMGMIVLFASVVIFVILRLLVVEKTRDLGVLASLGAPAGGIVWTFLAIGMTLSITGAGLGVAAGYLFTAHINEVHDMIYAMTGWRLFPPEVYYLTRIPAVVSHRDLMVILIPTIFFGFKGSLFPALRAARQDPIGALRYE